MESKELSKLQIRSEVLMTLQKLASFNNTLSKIDQDKYLDKLRSIKNTTYVLEILVKELSRVDEKKGNIIGVLLLELGTLKQLKEPLWLYIKSPKYSDEFKNLVSTILKSLGDNFGPDEFLSYLNDPEVMVDQETQKLLETAAINPEAQIDFLDFLFSLPEDEQLNLAYSLKQDYTGENLVNVLIPALESKPSSKLEEFLIKLLGETRTPLAVPALVNHIEFSKNEITKKLAKKSLNLLKLSGVNIEKAKQSKIAPICHVSNIYECYTNNIDGSGNQIILVSRIKQNQDILMFSVIINDTEGIVDCFGFYGINKHDFSRIINKLQEESPKIFIAPEYCKYKLEEAEIINRINNFSIAYEYIAWKSIISDVSPLNESIEQTAMQWANKNFVKKGKTLYKHPDFKYWFLEDDDHPAVKPFIEKIIAKTLQQKDYFIENPVKLMDWLEEEITGIIPEIFDENLKEIYRKRLLNIAYLLNFQELSSFRNIASSLAWVLSHDNDLAIEKLTFFRELLKKTIFEGFSRYEYNLDQSKKPQNITFWKARKNKEINDKSGLSGQSLNDIIDILDNSWLEE
ncbi:MAG: hypothetical protein V2B14_03800 [bacterium]